MGERWRVEVDCDLCIGSGLCMDTAPDTFEFDSARQSRVLTPERDASDAVRDAAENCPAEAISLVRADTGEKVFPPDE
ncbi:ferredoxin [Streptomyces boncukensis]|uniref:Ferredoxin n=1 Tax=Streptomyces boncukensis TaxID=2711219 RepID=A0A6G4X0I7_9ACTN|nr:ferredoxin [Streptomyces boncukensis]NGO71056.1 ferredoxin [Streptomyces boncukensis]